ncbi:speckle-type POZ protein [Trichonephila clavipes]|nr:speckle-type POZ protein [Trichonephila clavipes]
MWTGERNSSKTDLCFARPVLGLERKAFVWSIREFKSLQPGQKRSIRLNPSIRGGPAPVLSISIRKREQDSVTIDLFDGSGLKGFMFSSGATETRPRMFQYMLSRGVSGMRKVVDVYDADTLHRLLHYIYTDTVEGLPVDSAISLYTAANRYKLMNLEDRCSTILKEKICKCSIGKILELANSYDDGDLKMAANHFIFLHRNDICGFEDMKISMRRPKNSGDLVLSCKWSIRVLPTYSLGE